MKTNLEWYPHRKDSHRHPKFKMLRSLYGGGNLGWSMEARFWALNNLIADQDNCELDFSKPRMKAVIAEELGLSLLELDTFIAHLKSVEVELLFEIAPGIYSTKKVKESLASSLIDRRKARERKEKNNLSSDVLGKSKNSTGNDKNSDGKPKSSSELNHTLQDTTLHNKTEHNITLQDTTTGETCGNSFEKPDFEDEEKLIAAITDLFATYADNPEPDFTAEIKPVIDAIFDKRECMTPDICYQEIYNSFLIMKQKRKTNTDFLLGIIKNKLASCFSKIQEQNTKNNQAKSNRIRAETSANERENEASRIAEKIKYYKEFFEKNEDLFSARDKVDILKYLKENSVMNLARVIEPKIEETITL